MLNVQQFETIPELAGNPFLSRLFQMFDTDRDNKLTQEEFNSAIDYFLRAQAPVDRIKCKHHSFLKALAPLARSATVPIAWTLP
jgi:hypothetical protein